MKKKLLLIFLGMFLLLAHAIAQQTTITGKVTSEDGPIPGVSIRVKGSTTVAQSNADGSYTINAANGSVLVFSYIGYVTAERTVGTAKTINVSLKTDAQGLDDVVVVGYGTQRKGNLTGAVSTIDVKKTLEGRPIADVGRALQGAASGLSVTVPSGEIGSDPVIKIRGQLASIAGGSSPLILLDNVEIPSIQLVNPNDIASITILKDAAAASIYGAKAAFGVILITTKQGSGSDKPSINYSNNFSFQNVWKDLKMADVNGLKYTVDASERIGVTTPVGAFYYVDRASYEKAVAWKEKYGSTIGPDDPTVFGRDWYVQGAGLKMGVRTYNPYDYMIKEWAPTQQHNLSVGGTTGKTSYNIGLAMLDQSGMLKPAKEDRFTRYNASFKISSEINKYLTIRGGALYSRRNKQYAYTTNSTTADPWLYLYRWSSLYPLGKDENGDAIRSPESEVASANTANILLNYANVNLGSTVNILKNWKVDFDYTFTNQTEDWKRPGTRFTARNSWVAPKARLDASGAPVYVNDQGQVVSSTTAGAIAAYDLSMDMYTTPGSSPDHFARSATSYFSHTINAFTTYNLNLKENHDFKFILGLNRVTSTAESQFGQITNLSDIINPQFRFGTGLQTVLPSSAVMGIIPGGISIPGSDKRWEAQLGYFGRVNYAFKNKYLIEGNLRYDGSSKFPTDLQWRWFPSFSAGWVASEESFMTWTKPVLNQLKFRGSWGSIGDQTVPNNLYIATMPSGQSSWIGANGAKVNYVGTPDAIKEAIQWQDIVTTNLGVDATLLNNKVNVSFDLFQRNTNNMIVPQEGIPFTFGAGAPQGNFGCFTNQGMGVDLRF
jgi:TonB-linked SusC/RagA family outer membrane protein